MNILVTGANGQLGQAIRAQSHRLQNHNIVFTDVISNDMLETILLDITSEDAIRSVASLRKLMLSSIVLPIRMWKKRKQILKWQILSIVMP